LGNLIESFEKGGKQLMARNLRGLVPCAVLGIALLVVGCGGGNANAPKLAPASGKVMLGADPLPRATVTLVGEKGQVALGMTDDKGVFYLTTGGKDGAPIGKCKVGISVGGEDKEEEMKPPTSQEEYQQYMAKAQERMRPQQNRKETKSEDKGAKLTERYGNPEKSTLTAEIPPGGVNDLMFRLTE
jgi:hypothetical protein